jgi:beta-lactamase class A
VWCSYRGATHFDAASIIKATTVSTMLWQAQRARRALTPTEKAWAKAAITRSDNAAETAIWRHVGAGAGVKRFLTAAGMTRTTLDPAGRWGITQVTARDQVILLRALAQPSLLSAGRRAYILSLMRSVPASQRWGVPAGAPAGTTVANKNGWLPRATKGWRINSIGYVTGRGHRYVIAILSDTNPSMGTGISRIQKVTKTIHRTLA